ncbi:protein of unknown function [Xenorhabdus poinarii G6]|uniref:Uncharacterized protein n=1 Tax=Xenorhabdus poinarii G6 TaxID=1354304 RepID=A0A068R3N3_9GAMM|nr:protein of unknown function [Xenorhabdus poinarii G6]
MCVLLIQRNSLVFSLENSKRSFQTQIASRVRFDEWLTAKSWPW